MPRRSSCVDIGGYTAASHPVTACPFARAIAAMPPMNVPQMPRMCRCIAFAGIDSSAAHYRRRVREWHGACAVYDSNLMTTPTSPAPSPRTAPLPAAAVPFASSIRLWLAALVVAVGLPFVVYIGVSAVRQAGADREEALVRLASVARLVAARVDDYIGDMESTLALASRGVTIDAASTTANDRVLQGVRGDLLRSMNNIGLWDLTGRNVGTLDRVRRGKQLDIGDRSYFREALTRGTLVVAGPIEAPAGGKIVVFARPIRGADGRIAGVVTASTRLSELTRLLDSKGAVPFRAVVSIVNAGGKLVARSDEPAGVSSADADEAPEASLRGFADHAAEATAEYRGDDGTTHFAAQVTATRAPWRVIAETPAS